MLPALSGSSARRGFGSRRWYHGICRVKMHRVVGLGDPPQMVSIVFCRILSRWNSNLDTFVEIVGRIIEKAVRVAYIERRIKFGLGLPRASSDFRPRSHGRWCLPRCQPPDYILLILHRVYVPMWFLLLLFPPPLPFPSPCRI